MRGGWGTFRPPKRRRSYTPQKTFAKGREHTLKCQKHKQTHTNTHTQIYTHSNQIIRLISISPHILYFPSVYLIFVGIDVKLTIDPNKLLGQDKKVDLGVVIIVKIEKD